MLLRGDVSWEEVLLVGLTASLPGLSCLSRSEASLVFSLSSEEEQEMCEVLVRGGLYLSGETRPV